MKAMDEKSQLSPEDQVVAELVGDDIPGGVLWVMAFLVGLLLTGSFYITGLWFAKGMGGEMDFRGVLLMGLIPGMVGGATLTGLVFAIHESWTRRAVVVSLILLGLPLALIPAVFGVLNVWAMVMAPLSVVAGALIVPGLILFVRRKGWGRVKGQKGSWEENF